MQNHETDSIRNRKTNVCYRLFNWLYCLASVACAVLGPRVVHAHQAPDRALDAVRIEGTRPQIDGVLDDSDWGAFRLGYNLRRSFVDEGTNIFLVKLNYWLNI